MAQTADLSKTPKDWDKMSNVEKYKKRVVSAYGKERPKFYKEGLAYAQKLDAKRTPQKKARKRVAAKSSSMW